MRLCLMHARALIILRNSSCDLAGNITASRHRPSTRGRSSILTSHSPGPHAVSTAQIRHGLLLVLSSMATAASILAVVRAAAPQVRSKQDQLVFALHAAVLASGYRLVAVGEQAQLEGLQADAPDAPLTGWNSSSDSYSFAYISEEEAAAPAEKRAAAAAPVKLVLKVLVMGDSSLVTCLATNADGVQPQTLELNLDDYVNPASSSGSNAAGDSSNAAAAAESGRLIAKTYKNLDQLCQQVNKALADLTAAAVGSSGGSNGQKKQCTSATTSGQQQQQQGEAGRSNPGQQGPRPPAEAQQQPDPDYDPLRIGPPRRPLRVGEEDIMPHLGGGGLGGVGGGMLPHGPTGGGMHVGPGHPFFADRMRHPDVLPGRGGLRGPPGPGGMRWDPINPEGLEGWRPEDFQRPGPGGGRGAPDLDPDIGLPGPGRGTDWDCMYG